MDRTEAIAREHLISCGFANPVYEPDGKVPPDFVLNGRIAVEVRRLNENERDSPSPRGLEETEIPLLMGLQRLAESFGRTSNQAWWLRLRYKRPTRPWRELAKPARRFLEQLRDDHSSSHLTYCLDDNVQLEAIKRASTGGEMFHVWSMTDDDASGWVLEKVERNLRLCIEEKSRKTAAFRSKYPEWWLLLIDQVSYGLSDFDRSQFRQSVHISHDWDKVIVINPLDCTHYFEL